jgi:hypothetical protein
MGQGIWDQVVIEKGFDVRYAEAYPAWTWYSDTAEQIYICAGMIEIMPPGRVAEIWAIVNPILRSLPRIAYAVVQDLRQWHIEGAKFYDIRRAQCLVADGFPEGETLMKHLGYRWESTYACWGDDETSIHRYVWLAKEHE